MIIIMKCQGCQRDVRGVEPFCPYCGRRTLPECPKCASEKDIDRSFCSSCGKSFSPDESELQTLARSGKLDFLRKYMPAQVFDNLMGSRAELKGERRFCAIIFADISGFTSYSEKHEPEDVTRMLNDCFRGLVAAVERYEGMVNKFIGDCIMAVFGAPNAHEDDVERAVRCALDMQDFLRKYNEVIEEPLGLAIGVNAGPVVAGNIGSERQMEYTVIGDSVNLSQRLEAAAGRGHIYVGPGVKERCSPDIIFKLLEPIRVKGKTNPIPVHEVLGIQKSSLEFTEVAEVPYTPRFDEIKLLDRTLANLKNRQYFFATALGPIGSGKTRLAKEAFQIAQNLGIEIHYIKADSHHVKSPFYAFTQLCAKLLGEPCLSVKTNWIRLLPYGLDNVDQAIIKSVFELQSFSADHEKSAIHENREAMISVFFKLLLQLNKRSATLLILENVQFLDESSQDVLKCVLNMEGKVSVGIFLSLRSDKLPAWLDSPSNQCLMMKPFDGPSLSHFIENLLETKNIPEKLLWLIRGKGMGNPLYIQEIYRNLVSSKKIYNDKGQWMVDKDIEMVNIPSSLGGVFTTRIDTLNMHAKALLKTAAVLGESFSLETLKSLAGEHFSQIYFDELLKNSLLEENEGLFNFANPFILETAYRTNLAKDLEVLHLSIGASLEAKAAAEKKAMDLQTVDRLAYHFKRSNEPYKACEYLSLLAQGLMSTYQTKAAAETLIELLDSLEKKKFIKWSEGELTRQKTAYQIKLAQVLIRSAEFKEAASVIKIAFEAAKLLGNNEFMIRLLRLMATIYATRGQTDDALKTLQQALGLAKTAQSTELFVNLLADFAEVLQQKNNLEKAMECIQKALQMHKDKKSSGGGNGFDTPIHSGILYNTLGKIQTRAQKLDDAIIAYTKAAGLSQSLNDLQTAAKSMGNHAMILHLKGNSEEAVKLIDEAMQIFNTVGDRISTSKQLYNKATIFSAQQKNKEAKELFAESYELAKNIGFKDGMVMTSMQLDKLGL